MDVTTLNVLVSASAGFLAALTIAPVNAFIASKLKRDELQLQHKLNIIAKQRELFLEHRSEIKRLEYEQKLAARTENEQVKALGQQQEALKSHTQTLLHQIEELSQRINQFSSLESQLREDFSRLETAFDTLDEKVQPALFINARVELLERRVFTNSE